MYCQNGNCYYKSNSSLFSRRMESIFMTTGNCIFWRPKKKRGYDYASNCKSEETEPPFSTFIVPTRPVFVWDEPLNRHFLSGSYINNTLHVCWKKLNICCWKYIVVRVVRPFLFAPCRLYPPMKGQWNCFDKHLQVLFFICLFIKARRSLSENYFQFFRFISEKTSWKFVDAGT